VRFVVVALALAATASAQVTAPLLGWLPSGTQIRPIHGFPAAATLGSPVNAGHELSHIAVSPGQNYVLASEARTGEVLLVIPGVSANVLDTPAKPDQIVVSPRGESAALWFSTSGQLEILSGLPAAPVVRSVDTSFITAMHAMAVSDDGQWIAAASSTGVFEWEPDGVPHQTYSGSDAAALAFLAASPDLAIATSTQLLSISGSATSILYQGAFSPAGLAASFDNRKIVLADRSGTIYSVDVATHTASIMDCQCQPSGVFGLDGDLFRLTTSSIGAIKLFDAAAGAVLAVPGDARRITNRLVRMAPGMAALPAFTINLNPTPTGYLQQPAVTVTSSSAYPSDISGNIALAFASNSSTGATDQTIQFSTGGGTVNFTIPAGSTTANFSGAPSVSFSTGTTAGTITLTANVTAPTTASAVATQTVTNKRSSPVISKVTLSPSSGGVTVVVTGYSPTADMVSATFDFALTAGATLTFNDITVGVSPMFQTWYANTSSYATGSEFTLTVPFTVTGNPADMTGVTVTLINGFAASNPVTSQ
jgi:hypothetical protein